MPNGIQAAVPPAPKKKPPMATPAEQGFKTSPQPATPRRKPEVAGTKFAKVAGTQMTQFNKRIPKETADTFAILAVKTNMKVPQLLEEAAELLQNKYGKV